MPEELVLFFAFLQNELSQSDTDHGDIILFLRAQILQTLRNKPLS